MIVEVPLPLSAMPAAASPDALRAALADFYGTSPIVVMGAAPESGEMLLRASDAGDDRLDLFVFANADGSQARLVARLDNLGKGARSDEHTSELQSLMRPSSAVLCLKQQQEINRTMDSR